eukprot:52475-Eustigmatos_ZCMA.PRE.2
MDRDRYSQPEQVNVYCCCDFREMCSWSLEPSSHAITTSLSNHAVVQHSSKSSHHLALHHAAMMPWCYSCDCETSLGSP